MFALVELAADREAALQPPEGCVLRMDYRSDGSLCVFAYAEDGAQHWTLGEFAAGAWKFALLQEEEE